MSETLSVSELQFFDIHPDALPLYETLREKVFQKVPEMRIEVKKTQISFFDRYMFAAVSFTPVRRVKDRPRPFITLSFGLPMKKESSRIDISTEAYPGRWTHHVTIGKQEEIDTELLSWITEADAFAKTKRSRRSIL